MSIFGITKKKELSLNFLLTHAVMYKPEDVCRVIFALRILDVLDNIAMAIPEIRCDPASSHAEYSWGIR